MVGVGKSSSYLVVSIINNWLNRRLLNLFQKDIKRLKINAPLSHEDRDECIEMAEDLLEKHPEFNCWHEIPNDGEAEYFILIDNDDIDWLLGIWISWGN